MVQAAPRFRHHQLCCRHNLQLIQNHVAPSHGPPARVLSPFSFPARSLLLPKPVAKGSTLKLHEINFHQSRVFPKSPSWLPLLGLNPSTNLPLQPHFRLLPQSVTPASILIFFQPFLAAILSPGRHSPMAWSQSSPSSHAGTVTRGSCFPVPSWVEFPPIPLAQRMATAI